ncbi:MAG: condensation domain-containing protein [Pseudonocardiaceae bacterium]
MATESRALPLTLLDEGLLHLQNVRSQWNVQFELGMDHPLDEARLRQAVLACCRRHPLLRARLAPWKRWDTSYRWDVADEPDVDLVRVADCPDDAALDRLRAELYTPPIPLHTTPGLRVVLARRPGGDLVMVCASHLVADGVGVVRLMQTITRAYRDESDPPDPLPLVQARDLGSFLAPRTRSEKRARRLEGLRRVREALDGPSRIAVVGDGDGDGFGFVRRTLGIGETTTPGLVQRAPGTTVNDVLLAALHLTVQAWNTKHGMPTDRVGVQMPVNVRPADRFWEVVSNITSMVTVSTAPHDRTNLVTATAAVAGQTNPVRRRNRAYGLYDLLSLTRNAPLLLKRAAPRLLPYVNDRFVDTAMLSNLGRIPDPPSFDADPAAQPPELWFSPPCDPACSVAVGVATVGERLALVIRYRHEQFDAGAAEEFTDLLVAHLAPRAGSARPARCYQPRARHSVRWGRSALSVESLPCPG